MQDVNNREHCKGEREGNMEFSLPNLSIIILDIILLNISVNQKLALKIKVFFLTCMKRANDDIWKTPIIRVEYQKRR